MPLLDFLRKNSNMISTPIAQPSHPYNPVQIKMTGYIRNEMSVPELLAIFSSSLTLFLISLWVGLKWLAPRLRLLDRLTIMWFALTGMIHVLFEGYFVYYHTTVGQRKDIFGQLWKEYALSDSRYMVSNTFVVSAEALSATMIGPLALLTAYLVASKSTYRYQFQALVSTLHIYSDTLYYATSAFDFYHLGINHCRPELYYFWVYYVGMNAVWIVVPGVLLIQSIGVTSRAFRALDRMAHSLAIHNIDAQPVQDKQIKKF